MQPRLSALDLTKVFANKFGWRRVVQTSFYNYSSSTQFSFKLHTDNKAVHTKLTKYESFVHRSFFREFDKSILSFPPLGSKNEEKQYSYIRQHFTANLMNYQNLVKEGFYDTHLLTNGELCHLFEAIGASFHNSSVNVKEIVRPDCDFMKAYLSTTLNLLNHNALVHSIFSQSPNQVIKNLSTKHKKIAFCFCESSKKFISLPYPFWNSIATRESGDNWKITGVKSHLLKDDYDYFIVFCNTQLDNENHFGLVSFLLDKSDVIVDDDGSDTLGNEYIKIKFDNLIRSKKDHEIVNESKSQNPTISLNVIGRGQLMTSALILGLIKECAQKAIQSTLLSTKTNELLKEKSVYITRLIYNLESMIYLNAHQFESFDTKCLDLYLDSMIVKIYAFECFDEISKVIRMYLKPHDSNDIMRNTGDVVNLLNSYLNSSTSNRLLLATYALRNYGSWYFDHIIKMRLGQIYTNHYFKMHIPYLKRKTLQRYQNSWEEIDNIKKELHPKLSRSINCLKKNLEVILSMEELILLNYGKDCVNNQIDLNRLSSIIMSAYQMASVISRTNHSLITGGKTSTEELLLCDKTCATQLISVHANQSLIEGILEISEEKRSKTIHQRNIKYNGYFPMPVFDRII